ncbi:coiled-coil domain-containing protein 141 isoform X2 [Engraulis encrasicolus]|uniref:coiled-coil domain-containing protein 141 isoform X2 n=1 Tax=Engraulis encrasicolus TaxID=184585 RepID=UPI002FD260BF
MSEEGDIGGQPSTTTISTVAVQAGDSRIIITVLKCGRLVELHLTEAEPNLLEIGANQEETKKLLTEHEQLLTKLKKHEEGVWALLDKADQVAEEREREGEGEEVVFEAMADTLSQAWRTLISHLERRGTLLQLATHFFDAALEFAIKIDEAEEFQRVGQEVADAESLTQLLQRHSHIKRGLLERSMLVLLRSRELIEYLKEFQADEALRDAEAQYGARNTRIKVERLMELLQDRRRQVDTHMRRQQSRLEAIQNICHWTQQEEEVTHWFKTSADLHLANDRLGSSLTECEELLQEHKEFEQRAKDWGLLVERLCVRASDMQASLAEKAEEEEDYDDDDDDDEEGRRENEEDGRREVERVVEKCRALRGLQEHFWSLMMERQANLQEGHAFFTSANEAFEVLGSIEISIKALKNQSLTFAEKAKRHEELNRSIKEETADPLTRGQLLLQKASPNSPQVSEVQRMMGYIKERMEALGQECSSHRELATKRQQLVTSLEDHMEKISAWIKNTNTILSSNRHPGNMLSEAKDVLQKHEELCSQTADVMSESESIADLTKELRVLECSEGVEFSNKASLLTEDLRTVVRNLSAHVETLRPYVRFLLSAQEVEEQIRNLQEMFKNKPVEEEENEEASTALKEVADAKWQSLLERFLATQDSGNNFINSSNMVSEKLELNVKAAVCVVERTLEGLSKKKADLSEVWSSWQLHVNQMKSAKKNWKKFKDQLKKVGHDLRAVEEALAPASQVDLGSDLAYVAKLLENFNSAKPQFLQLNAEVEYLMKTSDLLALKGGGGVPVKDKEKSERVGELLQLHQRVKDKMTEYDSVLSMAVKFNQLHEELDSLLLAESAPSAFSEASQAKIQLTQHQERQSHVRHLYKLAISLGADITATVQHSHALRFSVARLQEKLERLEQSSVTWMADAHRCEESLTGNLHYCLFKEEISELRESFKDLKKKFNNMKFNYMKRNDKSRNMKAVKNQIQQIEIYIEKLQVLKVKMQTFTTKVSSSTEKHLIGSSPREMEDAVNELQRQLGDFDRTVEEYKQSLDMTVKLQQAVEEYQFWCDEASATIIRVGKYSSQCKTKEAVSVLYKQFEKYVWPTIPQQEERISQITELAVRLHGPDEGKKYVDKTISKHNEIVESIKELCNGLIDLEAKLEAQASKESPDIIERDIPIQVEQPKETAENNKTQPQDYIDVEQSEPKETGHTPEITTPGHDKDKDKDQDKEIPSVKKVEVKRSSLRKSRSQDLPDKTQAQAVPGKGVSETRTYTQEEHSSTSRVETVTGRSMVERKEEHHSTITQKQTFNVSSSPVDRDRKVHILSQSRSNSQETPPPSAAPTAPSFSDIQREFQLHRKDRAGPAPPKATQESGHTEAQVEGHPAAVVIPVHHSTSDAATSAASEADLHHDHLTEESLSVVSDEYDCASPDDISLPPLSETPESNLVQSENDLEDGYCYSSHSLHTVNQYSHQSQHSHSQHSQSHWHREWVTSQTESHPSPTGGSGGGGGPGTKFRSESSSFVQSPLTVPTPNLVSSTISSILKSKPGTPTHHPSVPPTGADGGTISHRHHHQHQTQSLHSVHESRVKTQESSLHESRSSGRGVAPPPPPPPPPPRAPSNTHATPFSSAPTSLTLEQDPDICKPTAIREEIRLPSYGKVVGGNLALAGQGPCFSRHISNATVMEGSPVTLEVEVTGFPEPTLTWFKNGQKLAADEHVELSQKEGKHAVFIKAAAEGDAGLYVVEATNSLGTATSTGVLQVTGKDSGLELDTFKLDWHTCFGTLCFLLWLLYLLVL